MPRKHQYTDDERAIRRQAANAAWYKKNSEKVYAKTQAWKAANPEQNAMINAIWYRANTEKHKASCKRVKAEKLLRLAGRPKPTKCEICNRKSTVCFDHCHKSNKFRGWICHNCNLILGLAHDKPKLLCDLARYLWLSKLN